MATRKKVIVPRGGGAATSETQEDIPQTQQQKDYRLQRVNEKRIISGLPPIAANQLPENRLEAFKSAQAEISGIQPTQPQPSPTGTPLPTTTAPTTFTPLPTTAPAKAGINLPTEEQFKQQAAVQDLSITEKVSQQFAPENQAYGDQGGFISDYDRKVGENLAVIGRAYVDSAFSIYDNLRALTSIGGSDTGQVKDAKKLMALGNTALSAITGDIQDGMPVDESEIISLFNIAYNANAVIQRNAKGNGMESLVYWLRGGKDLEAEALANEIELRRLRNNMLIALEQARVNKIKQSYGIA